MSDDIQRIQVRFRSDNAQKLRTIGDRYGISANSLVSFIVGQWLDQYDHKAQLQEKMSEQMIDSTVKHFSSGDQMSQMMTNPIMTQMMSELLEKVASNAMNKKIED